MYSKSLVFFDCAGLLYEEIQIYLVRSCSRNTGPNSNSMRTRSSPEASAKNLYCLHSTTPLTWRKQRQNADQIKSNRILPANLPAIPGLVIERKNTRDSTTVEKATILRFVKSTRVPLLLTIIVEKTQSKSSSDPSAILHANSIPPQKSERYLQLQNAAGKSTKKKTSS